MSLADSPGINVVTGMTTNDYNYGQTASCVGTLNSTSPDDTLDPPRIFPLRRVTEWSHQQKDRC
jgi:hypothetical protein